MAFKAPSFVKETTQTTGTGTYTLDGAKAGFETFALGVGNGNTCTYAVRDGVDFEIVTGTLTTGGSDTLTRATIVMSSNAGAAVNWTAGTRDIFIPPVGEHLADLVNPAATNGLLAQTAANAFARRTITGGNGITLTNGDGVAGAPDVKFTNFPLNVAGGGTGVTTLTNGGVLLGSGTGDITAMGVLANGSIIVGDGSGDPVSLAAFTSSTGQLKHERGGIEADISAIVKGGIVTGTGTGTMGVFPAGSNDEVLIYDSAQSSGFKTGSPPASGTAKLALMLALAGL